ncbi:hypothetical protein [Virgisporangium aurantiacum]|uniref:Uncharacterized protein n=1 Tax=Virgisporangium aurantiacum TaxID=175570 RepID=A0A8J4E027_9ACTN|nr:hypothetical protein [Virgisporangium aurantiacum]GIJ56574.1 hypothetical protein Vau01_040900 [Virgisporangium aurantiacum]
MSDIHDYLPRNRRAAARFVGRRLRAVDRLGAIPDDEEPRLTWGPLLMVADDDTGWLLDVDEGRSNLLLFDLDGPARVAEMADRPEHRPRTPVLPPDGPLGFLLREPIAGVDLVGRPGDPDHPHFHAMNGIRLRTASGNAAVVGTHLEDPRIPGTSVLLPAEVTAGAVFTPLAGDGTGTGFDRIEYGSGNDQDPGDPFGRTVLTLDSLGVARLDNDHVGRHRTWTGVVDPAMLARLTTALREAGYPAAPRLPVPAGSSLRSLSVSGELAGRVLLPWHGVSGLPGYGEAFAVLDSVVHQLSRGELPVAPDVLPPSVLDIHEH